MGLRAEQIQASHRLHPTVPCWQLLNPFQYRMKLPGGITALLRFIHYVVQV
jgi:hypothetical protein